jgi:hypothetical protein
LKDKLIVNGQIYMESLKENIQIAEKDQGVDTPVVNWLPGSEEVTQQNKGNKIAHDYRSSGAQGENKMVLQTDIATWKKGGIKQAD